MQADSHCHLCFSGTIHFKGYQHMGPITLHYWEHQRWESKDGSQHWHPWDPVLRLHWAFCFHINDGGLETLLCRYLNLSKPAVRSVSIGTENRASCSGREEHPCDWLWETVLWSQLSGFWTHYSKTHIISPKTSTYKDLINCCYKFRILVLQFASFLVLSLHNF